MKRLPGWALRGLHVLVAAVTPVALLLTTVRLLLTPVFVQVEYRTPGFPEDTYGFTREDRLLWASLALDYLLNDEGIEFLGDLRFEDGEPLYNERELMHMVDVKVLVQALLKVWLGLALSLGALGVWAWRTDSLTLFVRMLGRGGVLTGVVAALLLGYLAVNFNQLFIDFHSLFFEGDSWLFLYSDTLIRLFPVRFWRDAFLAVGGLTLGGAAGLWWLGKRQPTT
ncbi:MAG: TIGR01906 family membrane protein [Anaerolineae bacterium]|nr:MAG: TIGR01906 family membrane protein [Anaerolineae bacterium]